MAAGLSPDRALWPFPLLRSVPEYCCLHDGSVFQIPEDVARVFLASTCRLAELPRNLYIVATGTQRFLAPKPRFNHRHINQGIAGTRGQLTSGSQLPGEYAGAVLR